jgi:phosphoglycolate phosphatase
MTEVDLMIFDFDGTLADTVTDLANAVNYTLSQMGYKPKKKEEIVTFVGDGIADLIKRSLGKENVNHYPEALKIFSGYYEDHLLDNTKLYPGVPQTLNYFHQKQKVILTNKRYNYTMVIARGLNIADYFIEIIGDGSTPYRKPDRRLVDYLIAKHGCEREKMVIIGDGLNDINLAKNSGILSCIYLNGLGNREELLSAQADCYCESLTEINLLFQ